MKKHFTTPEKKKQELKIENLIFKHNTRDLNLTLTYKHVKQHSKNDTVHVQFVTEYCKVNVVWNDQFAKEAPQVEY